MAINLVLHQSLQILGWWVKFSPQTFHFLPGPAQHLKSLDILQLLLKIEQSGDAGCTALCRHVEIWVAGTCFSLGRCSPTGIAISIACFIQTIAPPLGLSLCSLNFIILMMNYIQWICHILVDFNVGSMFLPL